MTRYILLISMQIILAQFLSFAQEQSLESLRNLAQKPDSTYVALKIITKYQGDSMLIRWAPNKAGAWTLLNKVGYILQRSEVSSDTSLMNWKTLNQEAIKPKPLEQWSKFAEQEGNTYPLIAAQAIWGKTFSQNPTTTFSDKVDELSNRFSFTLLSADLSFETAIYAGLGFIDRNIESGKIYAYRIFAADTLANYLHVDTAMHAQKAETEVDFGAPPIIKLDEEEHKIVLHWDKLSAQQKFSAYHIERSENGQNFQRITSLPYIQMDNEGLDYGSNTFTYTDSLQQNYKTYWYRLIGIDAFGQESVASDAVKGMGKDKTPPKPAQQVNASLLADGSVKITWESEEEEDLAGFLIGRSSENSLTGFEPMVKELLPKQTRQFVDSSPNKDGPNYYIVLSTDTAKNATASMAAFMAFVDTIPPAKPVGLQGTIDSLGIVKLKWERNKEKDIKGYIVTYANDSTHIFTSAVDSMLVDNFYIDSISLVSLTEELYFKVRAVDRNYNNSAESEMIILKKPDRIPPVPAQFTDFQVSKNKVSLSWLASTSKDVVAHEVYRREVGKETWDLIKNIAIKDSNRLMEDSLIRENTRYEYRIMAIDDAGLRSESSAIVALRTLAEVQGEGLKQSELTLKDGKVHIQWTLPNQQVKRCVWYRAVDGSAFQTLQSFDHQAKSFVDDTIQAGKKYEYTCKLFYENGKSSAFSKVVIISP